jgi:hypothetical protein
MNIIYSVLFATLFAVLGWIFSTKKYITFLHTVNPVIGLFFYYTILYIIIFMLHYFGLNITKMHWNIHLKTIGSLLILFSFFIVFGWESEYMCKSINKDCGPKQSEDAAVFHIWYSLTNDFEKSRILTYVVTPFVLVMTGMLIIFKSVHRNNIKNINIE